MQQCKSVLEGEGESGRSILHFGIRRFGLGLENALRISVRVGELNFAAGGIAGENEAGMVGGIDERDGAGSDDVAFEEVYVLRAEAHRQGPEKEWIDDPAFAVIHVGTGGRLLDELRGSRREVGSEPTEFLPENCQVKGRMAATAAVDSLRDDSVLLQSMCAQVEKRVASTWLKNSFGGGAESIQMTSCGGGREVALAA